MAYTLGCRQILITQSLATQDLVADASAMGYYLRLLGTLVQQRIKQRKPDLHRVLRFKSRRAQVVVEVVLRQNSFFVTLIYVLLLLFVCSILELVPLQRSTIRGFATGALALTAVLLALLILLTVEQIGRLIHRTASYKMMLQLYFALVFAYAASYLLIEQIHPNSFHNIERDKRLRVLRSVQLYLDCLYFSNMCQSAVGFGDVSPYFTLGRVFVTTQMTISVGFISILFSNWIM